jgi:hypothetical protein
MDKTTLAISKGGTPVKTKEVTEGYLVAYVEDGKLKVLEAEMDIKAMGPMLLKMLAERIMH